MPIDSFILSEIPQLLLPIPDIWHTMSHRCLTGERPGDFANQWRVRTGAIHRETYWTCYYLPGKGHQGDASWRVIYISSI